VKTGSPALVFLFHVHCSLPTHSIRQYPLTTDGPPCVVYPAFQCLYKSHEIRGKVRASAVIFRHSEWFSLACLLFAPFMYAFGLYSSRFLSLQFAHYSTAHLRGQLSRAWWDIGSSHDSRTWCNGAMVAYGSPV
jgi:hypothetical protein